MGVLFRNWCKEQQPIAALCSKAIGFLFQWQNLPSVAKASCSLLHKIDHDVGCWSCVGFSGFRNLFWKLLTFFAVMLFRTCYDNSTRSPSAFTRLTCHTLADDSSGWVHWGPMNDIFPVNTCGLSITVMTLSILENAENCSCLLLLWSDRKHHVDYCATLCLCRTDSWYGK